MKWISVKDRLPDEAQEVLISPSHYITPTAIFINGEFGMDGRTFNVTHWMSLPEPPKLLKEEKGK